MKLRRILLTLLAVGLTSGAVTGCSEGNGTAIDAVTDLTARFYSGFTAAHKDIDDCVESPLDTLADLIKQAQCYWRANVRSQRVERAAAADLRDLAGRLEGSCLVAVKKVAIIYDEMARSTSDVNAYLKKNIGTESQKVLANKATPQQALDYYRRVAGINARQERLMRLEQSQEPALDASYDRVELECQGQ